MSEEIEITEENFSEYFRDARKFKPQAGEVLAKFTAIANFVPSQAKRDIIYLLKLDKAKEAAQVMNRIHGAKPPWSYRVPRLMAQDLLKKTEKEVEETPYEMLVEYLFWTKKEYVPKGNQHWELLDVLQYDPETKTYKVEI